MEDMNRKQRRDVRFGRNVRRSNVRQHGMSRRRFLGTAAAGVAGAMIGGAGVAHAKPLPGSSSTIPDTLITETPDGYDIQPAGETSREEYTHPYANEIFNDGATYDYQRNCTRDVRNIQWCAWALWDRGLTHGVLRLGPGTFEFGDGGKYDSGIDAWDAVADFVGLFENVDVTIKGAGMDATTINGGLCPIRLYEEVNSTISDIGFFESRFASINVPTCNNMTIERCKSVDNMTMSVTPFGFPYSLGFSWGLCVVGNFNWATGICDPQNKRNIYPLVPGQRAPPGSFGWAVIEPYTLWLLGLADLPPEKKKHIGSVTIKDNVVVGNSSTSHIGNSHMGMFIWDIRSPGAVINVMNNEVSLPEVTPPPGSFTDQGSIVVTGIVDGDGDPLSAQITGNTVSNGPVNGPGDPLGIACYTHFFDANGYTECVRNVGNNTVDISGSGGMGLLLELLPNSVISGNDITSVGSLCGIGSFACSGNTLQGNKVSGSGEFGILVAAGSSGNALVGNNVSTIAASVCPVLFDGDTHDNYYMGPGGLVNDPPEFDPLPPYGNGCLDAGYVGAEPQYWSSYAPCTKALKNNTITGVDKKIGQALTADQGNAIAEAMHRKAFFPLPDEEWPMNQ